MTMRLRDSTALAISDILFPLTTPAATYVATFTGASGTVVNTASTTFVVKKLL